MDNIIPVLFHEDQKVEPDRVLERARTLLDEVLVIGIEKDGSLYVAGSEGIQGSIYLAQKANKFLLEESDDE